MRGGKLIVEHSPDFLIKHFEVQNLEEVFLKVCRYDSKDSTYSIPKNYTQSRLNNAQNNSSQDLSVNRSRKGLIQINNKLDTNKVLGSSLSNKIIALTQKNYIRLIRNKQ